MRRCGFFAVVAIAACRQREMDRQEPFGLHGIALPNAETAWMIGKDTVAEDITQHAFRVIGGGIARMELYREPNGNASPNVP